VVTEKAVSVSGFALDVLNNWLEEVASATANLLVDVCISFTFLPWQPSAFGQAIVLSINRFINALQASYARAIADAVLSNFPAPKPLGGRVIRASAAYDAILQRFLDGMVDVSSAGGAGFYTIVFTRIRELLKVSRLLDLIFRGASSLWSFLGKTILTKLLKQMLTQILRICFQMMAAGAFIALLYILWGFLRDVEAGKGLPFLSQKAPRKKVHSVEDGVIRRREPGGRRP
jgi:hypothetical protein